MTLHDVYMIYIYNVYAMTQNDVSIRFGCVDTHQWEQGPGRVFKN